MKDNISINFRNNLRLFLVANKLNRTNPKVLYRPKYDYNVTEIRLIQKKIITIDSHFSIKFK